MRRSRHNALSVRLRTVTQTRIPAYIPRYNRQGRARGKITVIFQYRRNHTGQDVLSISTRKQEERNQYVIALPLPFDKMLIHEF